MAGGSGPHSSGRSALPGFVDSFLDTKLNRPFLRPEWVDRDRLLDQLDEAIAKPLVLVAAPAGFGKTTVLAQWLSRRTSGASCWVSLDSGDNDPVRLWRQVVLALERAGCPLWPGAAASVSANSSDISTRFLPRLVNALGAIEDNVVIVLDDFHLVREPGCHEQVELLVQHLPSQAHLLIATRSDPGLRLGRLRASGRLSEVRAADLAFSPAETTTLLERQQVQLSSSTVDQLVERTEGWPAGLYLATLSLSGREDPAEFVRRFSGTSQFVGDYLTEEVLSRHTDEMRDFTTSVSILDRLCAPLCDYITGDQGSAAILRELERTNLFLVPLDEHGGWYRFHHLFASVARGELEMNDPARVPELHARAAAWFREHGYIDEAIRHLLEAGHTGDAAHLVQANWVTYVSAGRTTTVTRWLKALGQPSVASDPAAGATAAWMAALTGDEAGLAAHLAALEGFRDHGPLPDGTVSVESAIAMIRGLFGFGGPLDMMAGAQRAVELETDGRSHNYAIATLSLGHAAYVQGDLDRAVDLLAKAMNNAAAPAIIQVLSAAAYSLAEAERGHQERARELAQAAMSIVDAGGLHTLPQASLAFTALGQVQAREGDLDEAWETTQRCLVTRRRHPTLSPWATMHHLLVAARVACEAGDPVTSGELLDEAQRLMDRFSGGMDTMRARLAAIRDLAPVSPAPVAVAVAVEPLTDREVDVLRLLQGSLSLREIADELYVSHNTVKTHTRSLYRKLGARSRPEVVRLARGRHLP